MEEEPEQKPEMSEEPQVPTSPVPTFPPRPVAPPTMVPIVAKDGSSSVSVGSTGFGAVAVMGVVSTVLAVVALAL